MTHQITTDQIRDRLSSSFIDVKKLDQINVKDIEASPDIRIITCIQADTFTLQVGVFETIEAEYVRFVYIPQVVKAYSF